MTQKKVPQKEMCSACYERRRGKRDVLCEPCRQSVESEEEEQREREAAQKAKDEAPRCMICGTPHLIDNVYLCNDCLMAAILDTARWRDFEKPFGVACKMCKGSGQYHYSGDMGSSDCEDCKGAGRIIDGALLASIAPQLGSEDRQQHALQCKHHQLITAQIDSRRHLEALELARSQAVMSSRDHAKLQADHKALVEEARKLREDLADAQNTVKVLRRELRVAMMNQPEDPAVD
jgi:hypothetical protein